MSTADHNNLVDAIETTEIVLGTTDNTMAGRVSPAFSSPVGHQLQIASIAGRNPRYPFGGPNVGDFFGVQGMAGVGDVIDGAVLQDWSADAPYARLGVPASGDLHVLTLPVGAGPDYGVVYRLRWPNMVGGGFLEMGFHDVGSSDVVGIRFTQGGQLQFVWNTALVGPAVDTPLGQTPTPWVFVYVGYDGTSYVAAISTDGQTWEFIPFQQGAAAPDYCLLHVQNNDSKTLFVWIDWVQVGAALLLPYPY